MSDLVTASVTVPSHSLPDLYTFVAGLNSAAQEPVNTGEQRGTKDEPKQRAAAGFGAATVKKNYLGGVSDYWRPFLDELAAHPDEWVSWGDLCEAVDLEPTRASGMLGAAERRCKLLPRTQRRTRTASTGFGCRSRSPTSQRSSRRSSAARVNRRASHCM